MLPHLLSTCLRLTRLMAPLGLLLGCAPASPDRLLLDAPQEARGALEDLIRHTSWDGLELLESDTSTGRADMVLEIRFDEDCSDCYRLSGAGNRWSLSAGGLLGIQYGVTELLEELGLRFLHPFADHVPDSLQWPEDRPDAVRRSPDIPRRGLHMHTLHPIEGMFDFWMPDGEGTARAEATIDWVIKNYGNHIQWVSLDNIEAAGIARSNWQAHTAAILDAAHARGVTVGLGVQLFGSGNLQQAFDLLDEVGDEEAQRAAMLERWSILTEGLDFDLINLSFGEFFGEDPATFIDSLNRAWDTLQELQPGTEMTTVIHVGEDLRITYQGEEIIYYFLAAEGDEAIVPWVHTVMHYNLFEPAQGAYGHEEFNEHRDFLLEALDQGRPVGYFPETAYWVSFDVSVPQQLPLYVRSRWLDLDRIEGATGVLPRDHVLFSSGWEWGYWLHDRAALRMSYELPDTYDELILDAYRPLGPDGEALGAQVAALSELQATYHLTQGLAPYLAGRDAGMELGDATGIIAQPPRVSFVDYGMLSAEAQELHYQSIVVDGLEPYLAELQSLYEESLSLELPRENNFVAEVLDGLELAIQRADFVAALYAAASLGSAGLEPDTEFTRAISALETAREVVTRRHADLHDPKRLQLLQRDALPTLYQYGYLLMADELCFWERELVQARQAILGLDETPPGCLF